MAAAETQELARQEPAALAAPIPTFGAVQMAAALKAYKELQRALDEAMPESIMMLDRKPYRKKGYWRAVAVAFNLSVEPIEEHYEVRGNFDDGRPNFGYVVTYRATMPNGRTTTGDGACFAIEKAKKFKCPHPHPSWEGKTAHFPPENCPDFDPSHAWKSLPAQSTDHNIRGHAHTRAYNRAVSNLVGFGEVSAEEVSRDEHVIEGEVVSERKDAPAQAQHQASGDAPKPAATEQPLEGVSKVKSAPAPAEGKPMMVTMENGAKGSTFDEKLQEAAKAAAASGQPRAYRFEKKGKYTNLMELREPAAQAPPPVSDEELAKPEPAVAETILVTRKLPGDVDWWVIQGSEREYVTNQKVVHDTADEFRRSKTKVIVAYDRKRGRNGGVVRQANDFALAQEEVAQ
jgi:hypothetical protein